MLGDNSKQVGILITIIITVMTWIKGAELADLTIEEKKLNIEKLQRDLRKTEVSKSVVKDVINAVSKNNKVIIRRSNFYKQLSQNDKIKQISISCLSDEGYLIGKERVVKKNDFHKYVLLSQGLKPVVDDNALLKLLLQF